MGIDCVNGRRAQGTAILIHFKAFYSEKVTETNPCGIKINRAERQGLPCRSEYSAQTKLQAHERAEENPPLPSQLNKRAYSLIDLNPLL
jgi:hypothetical protein